MSGGETIGGTLGGYRITGRIGRGGMGEVYEGFDETLQRRVAVKVLLPYLAEDPDFTERFLREARSAAALEHPAICAVYSAGRDGDRYFIAMQYIEGQTLASVLEQSSVLPEPAALRVARTVASALAYAHGRGVIHRDIKPENIMIDVSGKVMVMDFGLAKKMGAGGRLTATGTFIGTPEYCSPEQCETRALDGRADIYSLGVVLYETLTGRVPFEAETPFALFKKIVNERPTPIRKLNPKVSAETETLVMRMLEKSPDARPQSADEVAAALDAIIAGLPADTDAETLALRIAEPERAVTDVAVGTRQAEGSRRRSIFTAAGALAAVAAALLVFALTTKEGGEPPRRPTAGRRPEVVRPAPVKDRWRVAVAPLADRTGGKDLAWLREAFAEMLSTDLSQFSFFDVVLTQRLLERDADPMRAAEALGVEILVRGDFRTLSDVLAVNVQAVDVASGSIVAGARSRAPRERLLALVDEVSEALRAKLAAALGKAGESMLKVRDAAIKDRLDGVLLAMRPAPRDAADRGGGLREAEKMESEDKTDDGRNGAKNLLGKSLLERLERSRQAAGRFQRLPAAAPAAKPKRRKVASEVPVAEPSSRPRPQAPTEHGLAPTTKPGGGDAKAEEEGTAKTEKKAKRVGDFEAAALLWRAKGLLRDGRGAEAASLLKRASEKLPPHWRKAFETLLDAARKVGAGR